MAEMFLRWVAAGRPGEESAEVDHSPIGRFYAQRKIACARKRSGSTTYYRNTKGERIKLVHELRRRQLRKAA